MPELRIENVIRERLSQIPRVRIITCRDCGADIVFLKTKIGGIVAVDLELKKHVCKRREDRGGNYGRL